MSTTWSKVWRDIRQNKLRTIFVVLSIAIGVFAIGVAAGTRAVISKEMAIENEARNYAHLEFYGGPIEPSMVRAIESGPNVAVAEAEVYATLMTTSWRLENEAEWHTGGLLAREDFNTQQISLVALEEGRWPGKNEAIVDRQTARHFGIQTGDTIVFRYGNKEQRLPVTGIAIHPDVMSVALTNYGTFLVTYETAQRISPNNAYNQLNVQLNNYSQAAAEEAGLWIEEKLEAMDAGHNGFAIIPPDVPERQDDLDSTMFILLIAGSLSLALSTFLIINTINALLAQQIWQIGVMKVVGATFWRVLRVYLATTLLYGLFALILAVPFSVFATNFVVHWMMEFLVNIPAIGFAFSPATIIVQVVIALLIPTIAAILPVIHSARLTPQQAISKYGIGSGFGRGRIDRLIGKIRNLPIPLAFGLRNLFRRKLRTVLTLLALVIGSVLFIVIITMNATLWNTFDELMKDFGDFDAMITFEQPYRVSQLVEVTEELPDVALAEVRAVTLATLTLSNHEVREVWVSGLPLDSTHFTPRITAGRQLQPGEDNAILLNHELAKEQGYAIGDSIKLQIQGRESLWKVVGITSNVSGDSYVPFTALSQEMGSIERAARLMVVTTKHDPASQKAAIEHLRQAYSASNIKARTFINVTEYREMIEQIYGILIALLLVIAVLSAIVGSIGLMGVMSINVLERGREVGVMRATGATAGDIKRIFILESVWMSVISWVIAMLISYPVSRLISNAFSEQAFESSAQFRFSYGGALLWLLILIIVSIIASLWPATRATKVSVQDALAYE
ncbi:MAG: ABC transporter permease [Anaerolineales bacterium]|nr:ABC transporter permease [Anaerolineales bacterium]